MIYVEGIHFAQRSFGGIELAKLTVHVDVDTFFGGCKKMSLFVFSTSDRKRRRATLCVHKFSINELAEAGSCSDPERAAGVVNQKLNVIARQALCTGKRLVHLAITKLIKTGIGADPQITVRIFRKRIYRVASQPLLRRQHLEHQDGRID